MRQLPFDNPPQSAILPSSSVVWTGREWLWPEGGFPVDLGRRSCVPVVLWFSRFFDIDRPPGGNGVSRIWECAGMTALGNSLTCRRTPKLLPFPFQGSFRAYPVGCQTTDDLVGHRERLPSPNPPFHSEWRGGSLNGGRATQGGPRDARLPWAIISRPFQG